MTDQKIWNPPAKIEDLFAATTGNAFSGLNSNKAGSRVEKELPDGKNSIQLYSTMTPNGIKVHILLEELGIEYDAHTINIGKGDQFNSGFVGVNPNSKIPALLDKHGPDGKPINVFESAAILLYLGEKFNKFLPATPRGKVDLYSWLFWQMAGQGPMSGNFGHFMVYAPDTKSETRDYGVARYGMEAQRLCSVLDIHLTGRKYILGDEYTIADMAIFPWFQQLRTGYIHKSGIGAKDFLSVDQYTHAIAWADRLNERPAVQRARQMFKDGVPKPWLSEQKN